MTTVHTILVLNPGSTSTKMAVFRGEEQFLTETMCHDSTALGRFTSVWDQFDFRMNAITQWLQRNPVDPSAVVGIGGLLKPLSCGIYVVNQAMLADARANLQGEHASNLGCALASAVAAEHQCPAFVVDPVSVDEFEPVARYSGHPLIQRKSLAHALNIHAAARRAAEDLHVDIYHSSFIVAHLGGGISIAPIKNNRIIDVNDASSDGPFSPERTGGLPLQQFSELCFSGKYTQPEVRRLVMGNGGLHAYLGTTSAEEVERRIANGEEKAREVYEAMAYQIAKEIGAMAAVLHGDVQAVILTGGLAGSRLLVDGILERVRFLGTILVYPGEDELLAMAHGALRVLRGEEQAMEY